MSSRAVTVAAAFVVAPLVLATGAPAATVGSPSTSLTATTTNGHGEVTATCGGTAASGSVDFGDGTVAVLRPPTLSATHAYSRPGTYTARLTCSDASGGTSTGTATVTSTAGETGAADESAHASSTLTPGTVDAAVTQATIKATICSPGWAKTVAPAAGYLAALKGKQMAQYHDTGAPGSYVEDHLIPLGLGGAPADPKNLWPQPRSRTNTDRGIATTLARQVCAGTIPLAQAQKLISTIKHAAG